MTRGERQEVCAARRLDSRWLVANAPGMSVVRTLARYRQWQRSLAVKVFKLSVVTMETDTQNLTNF